MNKTRNQGKKALTETGGKSLGRPGSADPWEMFLSGLTPRTRRAYETDIKQFCAFFELAPNDYARWAQITPVDIESFLESIRTKTPTGDLANASTVARKLSVVRTIMKWYRAAGIIDRNPADVIKSPRVSADSPQTALTKEECCALIDCAHLKVDKRSKEFVIGLRDRAILSFLLRTGARRDEVTKLRRSDLFEVNGTQAVFLRGKGQKTRVLPLHSETMLCIGRYLQASDRLLGTADDPLFAPTRNRRTGELDKALSADMIYLIVKAAAAVTGILRRVTPHSLRHTAITNALDNGAKLERVQIMAGHSSPATTLRYLRTKEDIEKSAAKNIDFGSANRSDFGRGFATLMKLSKEKSTYFNNLIKELHRCWYCGSNQELIEEHQVPKSGGGTDDPSNIVSACRSCNIIKGPRDVVEFRKLLESRIGKRVLFLGEDERVIARWAEIREELRTVGLEWMVQEEITRKRVLGRTNF